MADDRDAHLPDRRRDLEDDGDVPSSKPHLSQSESNMLTLLAAGLRAEHAPPPPPPPPKAGWTSLPAVIGAVVALISIVTSAVAVIQGYTQLGERVQSFGERMLTNDGRITVLERSFQERGQKRDGEVAVLTANNTLQDERMRNFSIALQQEREARVEAEADIRRSEADLRTHAADLAKTISEMRADLKVLVDRAQRPRADMAVPQRDAQVVPGR